MAPHVVADRVTSAAPSEIIVAHGYPIYILARLVFPDELKTSNRTSSALLLSLPFVARFESTSDGECEESQAVCAR